MTQTTTHARMSRVVARFLAVLLGAFVVLGVTESGQSAAALTGCPPQSSLCSPAGMAVLADANAMAGGLTATGAATYTGTTGAVSTVGWVSSSVAASGALTASQLSALASAGVGLTVTGAAAVGFALAPDDVDLFSSPGAGEDLSGWTGGVNAYGGVAVTMTHDAANSLWQVSVPYVPGTYNYVVVYWWNGSAWSQISSLTAGNSGTSHRVKNLADANVANGLRFTITPSAGDTPIELGRFYPEGHAAWEDHSPNPVGAATVTGTLQCLTAGGDVYTKQVSTVVYTADTVGGKVTGVLPAVDCGSSPGGAPGAPQRYDVGAGPDGGTSTGLGGVSAPSWQADTPTEFPNCIDGSCDLGLWQKFANAPAQYCGTYAVGCPQWTNVILTNPDAYECRYGQYVVDMGACSAFSRPGSLGANTGTDIDPGNGTRVSTGEIPDADPSVKPAPIPWVVSDPMPEPEPDPTTGGTPVPDPEPLPDVPIDSGAGECWPSGWGVLNPFEWVYLPVTCALQWAFVPSADVVAEQLQGGRAALEGHGVLSVVPAVLEVPGQIADGWTAGCSSSVMTIELDTWAGPMDAAIPCSPGAVSGDFGSQYSPIYALLSAVLVGGGAWGLFIVVRAYFGGRDA